MKTDLVIIGAGAVGLAIAERLSRFIKDIVVVERNDSFGRETSSRNSEVIHAGFYYPSGSLKARLCVEGNRLLYEFCDTYKIPCHRIGKLLVAQDEHDRQKLEKLYTIGGENGVSGLTLIDKKKMTEIEPNIHGIAGMLSNSTGIFDTHRFMQRLEELASSRGVVFAYGCEVTGVTPVSGGYSVDLIDNDGVHEILTAQSVINAAGLNSDKVAAMAGIDIDKAGYRLRLCKGEYFTVSNIHRGKINRLVYPAPDAYSLGVHAVLQLDGRLKVGPSAFFVNEIDYTVDPAHSEEFFRNASSLFPFIRHEDLSPDMAGIRPKLMDENDSFRDFIIAEESGKGLPGFIDLIGIESPGLTSSPAIAEYVARKWF